MANALYKDLDFSPNALHKRLQCKSSAPEGPAAPNVLRAHWQMQSEIKLSQMIGWRAVSESSVSGRNADLREVWYSFYQLFSLLSDHLISETQLSPH